MFVFHLQDDCTHCLSPIIGWVQLTDSAYKVIKISASPYSHKNEQIDGRLEMKLNVFLTYTFMYILYILSLHITQTVNVFV